MKNFLTPPLRRGREKGMRVGEKFLVEILIMMYKTNPYVL
jgi:hypothetical protein